jgi:threonine/homoserine/homoserine lactone efflux protein
VESNYLLRGIIIGLSIAAPVGPIGLLCIKRTLEKGKCSGFYTGLGAATADLLYGIIAAFGLTVVTAALFSYNVALQIIGSLFLLYLGVTTFLRTPAASAKVAETNLASDYLSTLGLTLTNPVTILSFMGIFAGLGFAGVNSTLQKTFLVLGVFLGSLLWWFFLSQFVGTIRHRLSPETISILNKCSGVIIATFGLLMLFRAL